MSWETYLSLTCAQFEKAATQFIDKTNKDRENSELTAWQVARWQVWRTLCPPDKEGPISVVDMLELPGDKKPAREKKQLTKEQRDERAHKVAEKWKDR